jgi:PAS domain-containing protein
MRPEFNSRILANEAESSFATAGANPSILVGHPVSDISPDQLIANQGVASSEERFRALVAGIKDYAIFMLDPEGRVSTWNTGAELIKGYKPEEIIGEHFSRFYTREDIERGKPVRRLPVVDDEGVPQGVLSMDDVIVHGDLNKRKGFSDLPWDEIIRSLKTLFGQKLPLVQTKSAAV